MCRLSTAGVTSASSDMLNVAQHMTHEGQLTVKQIQDLQANYMCFMNTTTAPRRKRCDGPGHSFLLSGKHACQCI